MSLRIYRAGLASITSSPGGLLQVRGNGTLWSNGNILPGDTFWKGNLSMIIEEVVDDEELLLAGEWEGSEFTDEEYFIFQNSPDRAEQHQQTETLLAVIENQRVIFNRNVPLFSVVEYGVTSPPVGAVEDDLYVVASSGTSGVFAGHENELAIKTENGWAFLSPEHGWHIDAQTDGSQSNVVRHWDGSAWAAIGALAAAPDFVGNWSSATAYTAGQIVLRLGTLYIAITANTNQAPENNVGDEWAVYASVPGLHGGSFAIHYTFRTSTTASVANTAGNLNAGSALGSGTTMIRASITDIFGANKGSQLAAANSASTSTVKGKLRIVVLGDLTKEFTADVTSVSSAGSGTRYDFVTENATNVGTISDGTQVVLIFTPKGDKGDTGNTGADSTVPGPHGGPFAIKFLFDTATGDADPTSGKVRLGSATQNASTVLRVNDNNAAGASIVNLIADIANTTNSPLAKGRLALKSNPDGVFINFNMTAVTDAVNYTNITIAVLGSSSPSPFVAGDEVVLSWVPLYKGAQGEQGIQGDTGEAFEPDHVVATLDLRDAYDEHPAMTSVLVEQDSAHGNIPILYFLLTPAVPSPAEAAVWSSGFAFAPNANASSVAYDNTNSALDALTVQDAIDEIVAALDEVGEGPVADVASAATLDVSAITVPVIRVTGAVTITALTMREGQSIWIQWAAAGSITHNASTLPLHRGVSRTNTINAFSKFVKDGAGVTREIIYTGPFPPIESTVLSGSAVALTTQIPSNVTSISLPAGAWWVWGNVGYQASVAPTDARAAIHTVSATVPTPPNGGGYVRWNAGLGTVSVIPAGAMRITVASTTTVYLVARADFSGTCNAYGYIGASPL